METEGHCIPGDFSSFHFLEVCIVNGPVLSSTACLHFIEVCIINGPVLSSTLSLNHCSFLTCEKCELMTYENFQ